MTHMSEQWPPVEMQVTGLHQTRLRVTSSKSHLGVEYAPGMASDRRSAASTWLAKIHRGQLCVGEVIIHRHRQWLDIFRTSISLQFSANGNR